MSLELAQREAKTLASLVPDICAEHEACEQDAQSAVEHAIRCGELLAEAKSKVRHGEWLQWLETNFPASEDTAGNYMRLARNSERVRNLPSQRAALAELAEPDEEFSSELDRDVEPEVVEGEVVEPRGSDPSVKCPTCGHMVQPDDIGTWRE